MFRLFVLVLLFALAGCAVEDEVTKTESWKQAPFTQVKAWDRVGSYGVKADVWVECEAGDKIAANYTSTYERRMRAPRAVYITRKDGTKWSLPVEVHSPGGRTFRIHTYHLTIKGREVNFYQP